jgi:hypothetical protein
MIKNIQNRLEMVVEYDETMVNEDQIIAAAKEKDIKRCLYEADVMR